MKRKIKTKPLKGKHLVMIPEGNDLSEEKLQQIRQELSLKHGRLKPLSPGEVKRILEKIERGYVT